MEPKFCDHLARLRDAGAISNEEFRAVLEWRNRKNKPRRRGGMVLRVVVAATVALLALLLIILDASFPVWLTTGFVIIAAAMLVPHAINDIEE